MNRARSANPYRVLWWCFLEARPTVQGIFLLRFLVGASFAGFLVWDELDPRFWMGALCWSCVTLSVYILNGVSDVEEDRANGSTRPIARGDLSVGRAVGVVGGLMTLALLGSLALWSPVFWSILAALVLGWMYSAPPFCLKRWPSGLAVTATLGGLLTYHAGYVSGGGAGELSRLLVFAGVMALWMGLVGQTKDLSDVEGDEQAGRRSGPIAWGEDVARFVYSGAAISLGAFYTLWTALFAPELLASAVVLTIGGVAVAASSLLFWSKATRSSRRRPYKMFMLTQYAVNVAIIVL